MAPDQIRSQILSKLEPKEKHDPQFTTGHDLVSSKFMACRAMLKYLQDCHCPAIFEVSLTLNMSQMNCKEEIRSCVMNRMAAIIIVLSQLHISASPVSGTVNPRKLGFSSPSLPPPPPPPLTHTLLVTMVFYLVSGQTKVTLMEGEEEENWSRLHLKSVALSMGLGASRTVLDTSIIMAAD